MIGGGIGGRGDGLRERCFCHAEKFSELRLGNDEYIIIFMNNTFLRIIGVALLVSFALAQTAPCPLQFELGSLISGTALLMQPA